MNLFWRIDPPIFEFLLECYVFLNIILLWSVLPIRPQMLQDLVEGVWTAIQDEVRLPLGKNLRHVRFFDTGKHIPLNIEMSLLQFYMYYLYLVEVLFLQVRVLTEVQRLEHVGLLSIRMLIEGLVRHIKLSIFNHFFYLNNTFTLFKSVCPLSLGLVIRPDHVNRS